MKNKRFMLAEQVITLQDIDMIYDDDLEMYLTINEVLCMLNDLHEANIELKEIARCIATEKMGGQQ